VVWVHEAIQGLFVGGLIILLGEVVGPPAAIAVAVEIGMLLPFLTLLYLLTSARSKEGQEAARRPWWRQIFR
jgi:hypothetical protein